MAASLSSFETSDSILTPTAAKHILDRHVNSDPDRKTALFSSTFPLQERLESVGWYTWTDNENATLIQQGFRNGHGHYRLYVFPMDRLVGWDPWAYPTHSLAVYYAELHAGEKWNIITAYPWSEWYYNYHWNKRFSRTTFY